MADLTGRRLGKYELVERLGRGGMAEVYKAYQPGMDRFVAVKVMHGHLAETEDFVTRFKREAQIVGQLRHPHILQVIDFDVDADIYYMVMEYIKGDTLKAYIQKKGELTPEESLRIVAKLADALFYAHGLGMIHRDIKPANVMFTDMTFTHPVLTDFGIARIISSGSQLTASGAFVGTPAYISPETARGESADERSDIYSMGVMLYEMLTGKVPYDADTPFAVIMKHVNEPLPSPRQFNIKVTDSVEQVLYTALAKRPDERYQTAQEFKEAVEKALVNLAHEHPTSAAHQTKSVAAEDKTFTFNPGEDMATMTYDKVNTKTQKAQAKEASTLVTTGKTGGGRLPLILGGVVILVALALGGFFLSQDKDTDSETDAPTKVAVDEAVIQRLVGDADRLMRVGDNAEAAKSFTEAIALNPNDPDLYVRRGVAYQRAGDNEKALADFGTALEMDNDYLQAYLSRALFYSNQGEHELALADYEQVLQRESTNPTALTGKALVLQQQGDAEEALRLINSAIDANNSLPEPLIARAELYLDAGDTEKALTDLNRAIAFDERNLQAYLLRTRVHIEEEDYEDALDDIEEVLDRDQENAEAHLYRGQIAYEQGDSTSALNDLNKAIRNDESLTLAYRLRGEIQLDYENYAEAIEDFNFVLESQRDAEVYTLRGWANLGLEDTEAARRDFEEALAIDSNYADAYVGIGNATELIDPAQALEAYTQAIQLDANNPDSYASRGWLYLQQGDITAAQNDFEAALALDSTYADAYEGLGDIYLAADDNEKALENYEKAIANGATSSWVYLGRGHAKSHLEQYEAAIEDFNLALANAPEDPAEIYAERGLAYVALGDYAAAIDDLTLALTDDEGNPDLLYARGLANFNLAEYQAAVDDFSAALDNGYADSAVIYDYRGRAYLALEQYESAIADYDAILAEDNSNTAVLFERGKAYLAAADYENALDDFTTVIERGYPTLEEVYTQRGIAYFGLKDYNRAETEYERAIAQNADYLEAYYQRALVNRLYTNAYEERLEDLNKVLELDPNHAGAYYYRGETYLDFDEDEAAIADYNKAEEYKFEPLAWVFNDRGVAYNNLNNDEEAIRNYTAALNLDPEFGLAYFNRGFSYNKIGDYERAIENLDLAIENGYSDPALAYYYKADSQVSLGEYPSALESLDHVLEINPDYANAYFLYGFVQAEMGNYEQSLDKYDRALELDHESPELVYANSCYVYIQLEDYDGAIANCSRAIDINPNYDLPYFNRGISYYYNEEYDAALDDYAAALDNGYEYPEDIYYYIGQVYEAQEDFEAAILSYTDALNIYSNYPIVYFKRAGAYTQVGNTEAAIADYTTYIDLAPQGVFSGEVYYNRGVLYVGLEEYNNALNDFTQAIEIDRLNSPAYYQRALVYLILEDTEKALADLAQVVTIDAQNADAYAQMGNIYYDQGEMLNALQNYRRYVEIMGTRSELTIVTRIAELEETLGDEANATPVPDVNPDTNPPDPNTADAPVYVGLAMTLPTDSAEIIAAEQNLREQVQNEGLTEEIRAELDSLIEANPTSAALLALRAEWKFSNEQFEEGFADAQAAVEADGNHPAGYLTLAGYYTYIEYDTEKTLEYSNQARQLAPENGLVALIQGNLFKRHSLYAEAIQAYVDAENFGSAPLLNILYERSDAYEEVGNWLESANDLSRLIEFTQDEDVFIYLRLALAQLQIGQNEEAMATINTWMPNADFYPDYYIHAAYVAYATGNLEQARTWLETGVALQNESPRSNYTLGLIEMAAGNYPAALEAFAKVEGTSDSDYSYPYLNINRGHLLMADQVRTLLLAGEVDGAFELVNVAIDQNFYESLYYLQRAQMEDARGLNNAMRLDFALGLSRAWNPWVINQLNAEILGRGDDFTFEITYLLVLFYNHEPARALMTLAKEQSDDPSRYDWLEGIILSREPDSTAGLDFGEQLVADNSENAYAYLALSAYYDVTGDDQQYIANVNTAYRLNPNDPYIVREYARSLWTQGNHAEAITTYENAEALGLNPLYFLTEKGYLQGEMGNLADSIATYGRYFALEGSRPGRDEMYYWLAIHLLNDDAQGALEAVQTYQDHVDISEDEMPNYQANLAYVAIQAGDLGFAEALLASSAEVNPDSARLKYMQALLAHASADYATATSLLTEISTVDPNEYASPFLNGEFGHSVMLDLAKAYAGAGQNDEARASFDAVITENPYWVQAYLARAQFFIAIGDTEAARADLQVAFDNASDPTLKAEIRDMLVELGN